MSVANYDALGRQVFTQLMGDGLGLLNPRMSPLDVGGQVGWSAEPDLHSKGEDLGWLSAYKKSLTRALGASRQP
jgi:hypothetical protein